jgi:hypothetical protein
MATTTLPCGKEITQTVAIEFSRRVYVQALDFSLSQLGRKDRWKIIRLLTGNLFSPESICRVVAGSDFSFKGKSLCQVLCPLKY